MQYAFIIRVTNQLWDLEMEIPALCVQRWPEVVSRRVSANG